MWQPDDDAACSMHLPKILEPYSGRWPTAAPGRDESVVAVPSSSGTSRPDRDTRGDGIEAQKQPFIIFIRGSASMAARAWLAHLKTNRKFLGNLSNSGKAVRLHTEQIR